MFQGTLTAETTRTRSGGGTSWVLVGISVLSQLRLKDGEHTACIVSVESIISHKEEWTYHVCQLNRDPN